MVFSRVVDGGDVTDHGEFGRSMGFEECKERDDARGGSVDGKFVFPDSVLLDVFG